MLIGALIGLVLGTVVNTVLILIVGRLRLGMEIDGIGPAFRAGLLVAIGNAIAAWLWAVTGGAPTGGIVGAITSLVVAAAVLLAAGRAVSGMRVKGFGGALVAAIAIAAVSWLINLVAGALV